MNHTSLRRSVLILAFVLVTLLEGTPAAKADPPTREEVAGPVDQVVTSQCAFPVLMHIEGAGFITTFTDGEGNFVLQHFHFPNNKTVSPTSIRANPLRSLLAGPRLSVSTPTGPPSSKSRVDHLGLAIP
jgi:hypothetical protein